MCTRLGGRSDDGGQSYLVNYDFQRTAKIGKDSDGAGELTTPQPWDVLIVEKDPETDQFVGEPVMGAGKKIVKVQRPVNFMDLNLTVAQGV